MTSERHVRRQLAGPGRLETRSVQFRPQAVEELLEAYHPLVTGEDPGPRRPHPALEAIERDLERCGRQTVHGRHQDSKPVLRYAQAIADRSARDVTTTSRAPVARRPKRR